MKQGILWEPRVVVWFSCGITSAVAAKLAVETYGDTHDVQIIYCDTLAYEHPDNIRFLEDVQTWVGRKILVLKNEKYQDIMDVFRKRRFIVSPQWAPCTEEMKKAVRLKYAAPGDINVFGMTAEDSKRIKKMEKDNSQLYLDWILVEQGITKKDCFRMVQDAGIELPMLYRMGYKNNNCIGCVKGGAGYWQKIRRDFPERFKEMAALEREIGATIVKVKKVRIYLDELPDKPIGRYCEKPFECGVLC